MRSEWAEVGAALGVIAVGSMAPCVLTGLAPRSLIDEDGAHLGPAGPGLALVAPEVMAVWFADN